jgi:octaprenyl-diphosphate synthase
VTHDSDISFVEPKTENNNTSFAESQKDLNILLQIPLTHVETIIHDKFQHEKLPMLTLISHHIIDSGGKRVRPLLCVAMAHLTGEVVPSVLKTAAAIEFIHTATLLHDDVVDNGHTRRGKKTANIVWGNQASVLVGDHMFAQAFSMLAETENFSTIKMMSGAAKMLAEGEIIQLSLKQKIPTFQDHVNVLSNKTAALFASGCACGVILAYHADDKDIMIQNAYNFGFNFGISFQLIDDILDYQGNDSLGKKIGIDFFEGKFTLPLILAYNMASESDKKCIETIMLQKKDRDEDDFKNIKIILKKCDAINQAHKIAQDYIQKAEKYLNIFDNQSPVYTALKDMITKTLYRKI